MAIKNYIGWPSNVNQIVYDSSTIGIGQNAMKKDTLETGSLRGRQRSTYVPDVYNVAMEFDWTDIDAEGNNEYERFVNWYKYQHKYGEIPFEFPQILYSPSTGITITDMVSGNYKVEYYKITKLSDAKKSGTKMQMSMTFQTVYSGLVQIPKGQDEIYGSEAYKNHCTIYFSNIGSTIPVSTDFIMYIDDIVVEKKGYSFSENYAKIYYLPLEKGLHKVTFEYHSDTLNVAKDEYVSTITI